MLLVLLYYFVQTVLRVALRAFAVWRGGRLRLAIKWHCALVARSLGELRADNTGRLAGERQVCFAQRVGMRAGASGSNSMGACKLAGVLPAAQPYCSANGTATGG
jgi:hypothetical protein